MVFIVTWPTLGGLLIPRLWSPPSAADIYTVDAVPLARRFDTAPYLFKEASGRIIRVFCDPFLIKGNRCVSGYGALVGSALSVSYFEARRSDLLGKRDVLMPLRTEDNRIIIVSNRSSDMVGAAKSQDKTRLSTPQLIPLTITLLLVAFCLWGIVMNIAGRSRRADLRKPTK